MARKWTNSKGVNTDSDQRERRDLDKLRRELIKRPRNNNNKNYKKR